MTALILAAVLAIVLVVFLVQGPAGIWRRIAGEPDLGHFDRSAPVRSSRPNDALLCTPGLCDGVRIDRELARFDETPEELIGRIDEAMRDMSTHIRRVDDRSDPARARYVTYTPVMRFPDTTSFEAVTMEDGRTGLVAHARAQLGRSDLGNNRKRLETVIARIQP